MADPLLTGLCTELIVEALVHAGRSAFGAASALRDDQELQSELDEDETLRGALDDAVEHLLDVEAFSDEVGGDRLPSFLRSRECRQCLVPVFYADGLDARALSTLRDSFVASLTHATGISAEHAATHGTRLFDALVAGAQRALRLAIEQDRLSASEAMEQYRHRLLLDALDNRARTTALFARGVLPSVEAISTYRTEYCRQVAHREGSIVPPHLDGQLRRPLDDVYVIPRLEPERADHPDRAPTVGYRSFVSRLRRAVVLGDPGGGKTTLTKKIAWDISSGHLESEHPHLPPVAIRVILRDYGEAKRQPGWSLLTHIEQTAASRYQMPEPPPGLFEYLLRNGLAIVLLDGLDELLDTSRRREISGDVETFANLFPSTPLLVTSRRVGYDQAPLDGRHFTRYGLTELRPEQVREYVTKSFSLDSDEPIGSDDSIVVAFMKESQAVEDLRSNPLMLGLMCSLYRGENYIPTNRPDVYEKCALMLFERWDRQRGIQPAVPFESRLRPAMQYLAHWIYSNSDLQSGVSQDQLVHKATEYLLGRRFDDADEAREAAIAFIDLCKGRAWVFTDTGSNADGEPLFQFTHRTFLEYFTASYLVATNPTPQQLAEAMLPRIERREWDVVLQVSAQLLARRVEDSADALLEALLDAEADDMGRKNIDAFAREALQFLNPSPATIKRIVAAAVDALVVEMHARALRYPGTGPLEALFSAGRENCAVVRQALVDRLAAAADVAENLAVVDLALHCLSDRVRDSDGRWRTTRDEIWDRLSSRLAALAQTDWLIASDLVLQGRLSPAEAVERHGAEPLFAPRPQRFLSSATRLSVIGDCCAQLAIGPAGEGPQALATGIAEALRALRVPWVAAAQVDRDMYRMLEHAHDNAPRPAGAHPSDDWDADARFVAFAMLAVQAEVGHGSVGPFPGEPEDNAYPDEEYLAYDPSELELELVVDDDSFQVVPPPDPEPHELYEPPPDEHVEWTLDHPLDVEFAYTPAWAESVLGAIDALVALDEADRPPPRERVDALFAAADARLVMAWLDGSVTLTA